MWLLTVWALESGTVRRINLVYSYRVPYSYIEHHVAPSVHEVSLLTVLALESDSVILVRTIHKSLRHTPELALLRGAPSGDFGA